jgi:DNA-directed RNA polymerase alpha subunit
MNKNTMALNTSTTMTHEELLDVDDLMQATHAESNHARQLRAHALWSAAKKEREQGNRELADRLKAVGNRLLFKNQNRAGSRESAIAARSTWGEQFLARAPFQNRNFSDRTINALIAKGIDAPERLLFATEAELKRIPGIGPASLAEIMCYRARFLPEPASNLTSTKASS